MDPLVGASFIPKKPLTSDTGRGGGSGLFLFITLFIFVASLFAAVGAFGYTQFLKSSIVSKSESLKKAEGAFEPGTIQDLVRLDARLVQAQNLLGKHVAPSGLFDLLSAVTLERVQFTTFGYVLNPDGSGAVVLSGVADSFSTVALQSDQFGANKLFKDVVFSGITIEEGRVTFTVNAVADIPVMLYGKQLSGSVVVPPQVPIIPESELPPPGDEEQQTP